MTEANRGVLPPFDVAADPIPAPEPMLQFFKFDHLPNHMQVVSKPFCELAVFVCTLPRNPERTVALRKLLEAKDCAVRAVIYK